MSKDFAPRAEAGDDSTSAVIVAWCDNQWTVRRTPHPATVDEAADAVRALRVEGTAFAVITEGDEFFVLLRPTPRGVEVFVSDAVAALDSPFGEDALDYLDEIDEVETALDEDDAVGDEPWPVGNFAILADIGIAEPTLTVLTDDPDLWASEQLAALAEDLGCDSPWA